MSPRACTAIVPGTLAGTRLHETENQSDGHKGLVDPSEGDVEGEGCRDPESGANDEKEFESQKSCEFVVFKQVEPTDCGLRLSPSDEDDELDRDARYG